MASGHRYPPSPTRDPQVSRRGRGRQGSGCGGECTRPEGRLRDHVCDDAAGRACISKCGDGGDRTAAGNRGCPCDATFRMREVITSIARTHRTK